GHPAHVAAHVARRLHGVARGRARRTAELAPDLLGGFERAHDRVPRDRAQIGADLACRADRAAHRGDGGRAHLAADVAGARDRRDERVLDEVHQADGDGPAAGDGPLDRLLEASVVGTARRLRSGLGRAGGLPLSPGCSGTSLAWHCFTPGAGPFPIASASDARTRPTPRTASGTPTPPATNSQSDPDRTVVPSTRRSGGAVIAARWTARVPPTVASSVGKPSRRENPER